MSIYINEHYIMRINFFLVLFTSLLVLASCGRSTETVVIRSDPEARATAAPEQDQTDEEEQQIRTETPANSVRYGEWEPIHSLDPLFANNRASQRAIQLIYEGLVRFDQEGNIIPAHARQWNVDRDSTIYTFNLNHNRYFHDDESFITGQGRRVTAGDFKRSMERMASPDVPSDAAILFRDVVFGFDSFYRERRDLHPGKARNFSDIQGIIAQNDSTLRIELNRKDPGFLEKLASPYAVVYPAESVRHHSAMHTNPVGTGPFHLQSVTGDSLFILARNENYPGTRRTGGIRQIEIVTISDESRIYRQLASDQISLIPELGPMLIRGLVDENGNLMDGFENRYQLFTFDRKQFEIAYNPANRFDISREEAASILGEVSGVLADSLNIPQLEVNQLFSDTNREGFMTIRRQFPESVSRRNTLLVNFSDYETSFIANSLTRLLMNDINIRAINSRSPGYDMLFIIRKASMNPGIQDGTDEHPALLEITVPRFLVTRRDLSGIQINQHDWWINMHQLDQKFTQTGLIQPEN